MRVPVRQVKGSAKPRKETIEDMLALELSKHYKVVRNKELKHKDEAGNAQVMVMDIALPEEKLIVEVQKKLDNKGIMAEIARERVARVNGWGLCRLTEAEARYDAQSVLYKVQREIDRTTR